MIFAIAFLFWWCTTLIKFGWEVAPQCFLFKWKSMSEKFGREVMPPCFHFQSKSVSHAEVAPPWFCFWTDFQFPCYRRGQRLGHGPSPCAFLPHIRKPMWACTWAYTQAKHKNTRHLTYTALAPFSPSLMGSGAGAMPMQLKGHPMVRLDSDWLSWGAWGLTWRDHTWNVAEMQHLQGNTEGPWLWWRDGAAGVLTDKLQVLGE